MIRDTEGYSYEVVKCRKQEHKCMASDNERNKDDGDKERVEFIKYLPHARFCDENCALTIT